MLNSVRGSHCFWLVASGTRSASRGATNPDGSPGRRNRIESLFGGIPVLLDQNKFVVKSQSKKFSSKKSFEIVDGETGQTLGTAKDTTGFFASLLGQVNIEVRDVSNNAPL